MEVYEIKEGYHSSGFKFSPHFKRVSKKYEVVFSPQCLYPSFDTERDFNKLFGWSCGILPRYIKGQLKPPHHVNSVRVAWRSTDDGKIELALYTYKDGVRSINTLIRTLERGTVYQIGLTLEDGYVLLKVKNPRGVTSSMYVLREFPTGVGYSLYPYFGGNNPAPHDMNIYLRNIS
jgi:hypothetical protein